MARRTRRQSRYSERLPCIATGIVYLLGPDGEVRSLAAIRDEVIAAALHHHGGNLTIVAAALRIGRSTVYRRLASTGLLPSEDDAGSASQDE